MQETIRYAAGDYMLKDSPLHDLLSAFHLATGIPIALCIRENIPILSAPEHFPGGKTRQIAMHHEQAFLGYLMIAEEVPGVSGEHFLAAFALLEPLAAYIQQKEYMPLTWRGRVDAFRQVIWENADADLSISNVARMVGLNKTNLYKQFHTYTGMTIAQYIKRVRLEKAQTLLTETHLSVTEISEQVGFKDYNYFCRVFRKACGISANAYRKMHQKNA